MCTYIHACVYVSLFLLNSGNPYINVPRRYMPLLRQSRLVVEERGTNHAGSFPVRLSQYLEVHGTYNLVKALLIVAWLFILRGLIIRLE